MLPAVHLRARLEVLAQSGGIVELRLLGAEQERDGAAAELRPELSDARRVGIELREIPLAELGP
jgi:hypothetical protein